MKEASCLGNAIFVVACMTNAISPLHAEHLNSDIVSFLMKISLYEQLPYETMKQHCIRQPEQRLGCQLEHLGIWVRFAKGATDYCPHYSY
jgi:hypothetical protein